MASSTIESPVTDSFSPDEVAQFRRDGYIIARGLADERVRSEMLATTLDHVARVVQPVEYEADVRYPGAPESREGRGGQTVRRLLQAQSRGFVFTEFVNSPAITERLHQLLGPVVVMPLAHHNCIMTKQPRFSSDTGWHQDIRYWSFSRSELVSVWLALGNERVENGCLKLVPGTHLMTFERSRFDDATFLRPDLPENQALIAQSINAELEAGDVLFFHSRTFHAASRNYTQESKYSVVFTFRPGDNAPIPETRSSSLPELLIR